MIYRSDFKGKMLYKVFFYFGISDSNLETICTFHEKSDFVKTKILFLWKIFTYMYNFNQTERFDRTVSLEWMMHVSTFSSYQISLDQHFEMYSEATFLID